MAHAQDDEPMSNPNKRRGDDAERKLAAYLQTRGWPDAERALGAGRTDDRGDIHNAGQIVWECKSHKTIDLPGFLRELAREKTNARVTTGAVVVKRRGSADPADWYAVLELSDFTNLLIEAGYGDSISNPKQKESS